MENVEPTCLSHHYLVTTQHTGHSDCSLTQLVALLTLAFLPYPTNRPSYWIVGSSGGGKKVNLSKRSKHNLRIRSPGGSKQLQVDRV